MAETFVPGLPVSPGYVPEKPMFGDVIKATLDRTFDPIISQVERNFMFGYKKDPNYKPMQYATNQYLDYADEFAALPNARAALHLRSQIDRSLQTRETLALATTGQALGAGFFDPINYLGLTFGGPALSVGRAALRTGTSVAAIESVREGLIQASDPVATYEESAINIASSALFGAAFGAVVGAPGVARAQAFERTANYIGEFARLQRANENSANISLDSYVNRAAREERPFAGVDDATIQSELNVRLKEAEDLRAQAGDDEGLQALRDQATEIDRSVAAQREELGIRYIEDSNFDVNDPYGIPANWFTDSVLYKAITTPMKRTLQSKLVPTSVKKKFVDLADDMTLALNRNVFGVASDPSVYMRTATSAGQIAKMESGLKKLYGEVQQNPLNFDDWIASVTRKRVTGDENLSETELKALSVLDEHFGQDVTNNLEENGLIATSRGRENRIRIINEEIDALNTRRVDASQREIDVIDARIEALKKDNDELVRSIFTNESKIVAYEQAMKDITAWNKEWMAKQINGINSRLGNSRKTFASLEATAQQRGLTPKQQKLYDDLKSRIDSSDETLKYYNDLTQKINDSKTIDDLIRIREELDVTEKMADAMDTLSDAIDELRTRIDNAKSAMEAGKFEPKEEAYFPRFYKIDKIKQNREEFTKLLMEEFKKKPYIYDFDSETGDYVRVKLSTDPVELRKRAESTVKKILSEGEDINSGNLVPGLGRSKHFRHRLLDIPTSALADYIELNPVSVLNSYNARVRPRTLFQEKFGKDYRGVATEMELDMIRAGASEADINKMRVDFDALYRRIVSNVLDNPDAMDQKAAYALRSMATFAFMGGAGITSIGDFGRIVMQYELAPMMKGVKSMIDMDTLRMSGQETKLAGSAMEYTLGMYRLEAPISNNFVAPKLLNSAQHGFYILNGLTPITIAFKKLSGLVMGHTLVDLSIKMADGTISKSDRVLLLKHGIDEEMAKRIAKAPWQRNKEGLILPNTEQWADHIEIPEISTGIPIPVKLNVKEMSDDELGTVFDWLAQETKRNEKVSKKEDWTDAENAANESGDWRKFSKLRGYTDAQIEEFGQWIEVANEYIARFGVDNAASRSEAIGKSGKVKPEALGNVTFKRVTVIEANEDGSPVGYTDANGNYVAARYNRDTNTIFFDRDFIEGPMFERKAWLKPRTEGVDPLPDIFKTPRQWANFVMLHEINHSRFSAEELGFAADEVIAYENKINQLALTDFKAAKKMNDSDVDGFRVALNSGITNTVIQGTPADRPIITDGVVHIPMNIASRFGLKEDKFLKGYARIENGFLALPFQFYNFLFGSMNKTLAAMAHGQVKNRAIGAATMVGLSYMILKTKTKESTWDKMEAQDKIARSIDMSGLAGFYSDLFYRTMHSTIALGGPNITGGFISPKFKQRESALDVVTDLAGAGPSWAANVGEGLYKVARGEYGEGASDILRMMPMANMWFIKGEVSELAQAMRQ